MSLLITAFSMSRHSPKDTGPTLCPEHVQLCRPATAGSGKQHLGGI